MLLVIDNYDSFTYNLVQYLGELGAQIEVRRNNQVTLEEIESKLRPERIVISPGPGTGKRGVSVKVIEHFADRFRSGCVSRSSGDWTGIWQPRGAIDAAVSWQEFNHRTRRQDNLSGSQTEI